MILKLLTYFKIRKATKLLRSAKVKDRVIRRYISLAKVHWRGS